MTAITVLNNANVPTGPFTREQVADKLRTGEFTLDSLAFIEGLSQWTPLREVLAKVDVTPASVVTAPALVPPVTPVSSSPAYSYAATMQPPGHLAYAGFWLRFVANFIDGWILLIPVSIALMVSAGVLWVLGTVMEFLGHASIGEPPSSDVSIVAVLTFLLLQLIPAALVISVALFYFAKQESGQNQATYGKRILGLKVTDLSGQPIGFKQASGRFFGKFVSTMTLCIGYLMAGFTERKQALHDMLAGTLVIRK